MGKLAFWSSVAGAAEGAQGAIMLNLEERRRKADQAREERLMALRRQHEIDLQGAADKAALSRQESSQTFTEGETDKDRKARIEEVGLRNEGALGVANAQVEGSKTVAQMGIDADKNAAEKEQAHELRVPGVQASANVAEAMALLGLTGTIDGKPIDPDDFLSVAKQFDVTVGEAEDKNFQRITVVESPALGGAFIARKDTLNSLDFDNRLNSDDEGIAAEARTQMAQLQKYMAKLWDEVKDKDGKAIALEPSKLFKKFSNQTRDQKAAQLGQYSAKYGAMPLMLWNDFMMNSPESR